MIITVKIHKFNLILFTYIFKELINAWKISKSEARYRPEILINTFIRFVNKKILTESAYKLYRTLWYSAEDTSHLDEAGHSENMNATAAGTWLPELNLGCQLLTKELLNHRNDEPSDSH